MNDAERDLISGLFQRIRSVETARRDPDAEALISEEVSRQPHAPYAMAQTIVVQDRSIEAAQARIAELERDLADAREQLEAPPSFSQSPASSQSSASPWGPRAQETMARAEAARSGGSPWARSDQQMSPPFGAPQTGQSGGYGQQQPGYGAPQPRYEEPSRGGGFLSGALQTAAGVAAGAMIFQGAKSIFGGGEEKTAGATGDVARAEGGGDAADAAASAVGTGDAGTTKDIGDWYSGIFGGSDGQSGGDDGASGGDDGGDGGGDWT